MEIENAAVQVCEGYYFVEDVSVRQIAAAIRTPFYCYSSSAIEAAYDAWASAFAGHAVQLCYALKANSNQSVIRLLADKGAGAGVYGSVMASTYNTRQLVPEVMVDKNTFRTIRERPGYDDMIGLDIEGDASSVA